MQIDIDNEELTFSKPVNFDAKSHTRSIRFSFRHLESGIVDGCFVVDL